MIENESQRKDGRPCMENQQLLIDVLMFEKTNEIIRFNLDVNVILKVKFKFRILRKTIDSKHAE
jgi:hypothetical protein